MAKHKADKSGQSGTKNNVRKNASYEAAISEAEDLLRASMSPDYDPHRQTLRERGSLFLYQDPVGFAERARLSPIAHDAMRLVLADFLMAREMPPDAARDWLVAYLQGKADRPAGKSGRKKELALHNVIWMAVRDLTEQGMKATRNDGSPETSACDAVAEAMRRLELKPMTFDGIKRIWLKFQKLHVVQKSK